MDIQGTYLGADKGAGDGGAIHQGIEEVALMRHFTAFAAARKEMAAMPHFGELGDAIMARLKQTHDERGTIYVLGLDSGSAIEAAHLHEELVARYTAGKKRGGRDDREAVRSTDLSGLLEHSIETLPHRVLSQCEGDKDTFVIFAASPADESKRVILAETLNQLRRSGAVVCVAAPAEQQSLLLNSDIPFAIPAADRRITLGLQSSLLHAMCEGVEPEWTAMSRADSRALFPKMFRATAQVEEQLAEDPAFLSVMEAAREQVNKRLLQGGTVFGIGNGGSACDALQLLNEYERELLQNGRYAQTDRGLLSAGYLTCCGNDDLQAFPRGMESIRTPGNVVFGYTTSGNSGNVIDAIETAKRQRVLSVVFTGGSGGAIAGKADYEFIVPCGETGAVQEVHWTIGSALASKL